MLGQFCAMQLACPLYMFTTISMDVIQAPSMAACARLLFMSVQSYPPNFGGNSCQLSVLIRVGCRRCLRMTKMKVAKTFPAFLSIVCDKIGLNRFLLIFFTFLGSEKWANCFLFLESWVFRRYLRLWSSLKPLFEDKREVKWIMWSKGPRTFR